VPSTLLANAKLKFRLRLLGRALGTTPNLLLTARRVPRPPNGLVTPIPLPLDGSEFGVALTTSAVLTAANQVVETESAMFDVAPGDLVYFTLERASGDGYAADVGVLQHVGILTTV